MDAANSTEPEPTLKRSLGLLDVVMFGVGGIVGAGIYAIIGEAAGYGGSLLWLSFLLAALVAFLTAATYAELVSRHPDAGGSFEYVKQAFGLRVAAAMSVVMLFTGIVAAGAIAISFSSYASRLVGIPQLWTTLAIVAVMGGVNVAGVAQASWFNTTATVVTILGLAGVVLVSAPEIGSVDLLDGGDADLLGLGIGSALVFFSFIGFEDLVKMAEEVEEPERTLPRGLLISAGIVLAIYLAVAVAAVSALGPDELASSSGPLAEIVSSKAGQTWATVIVAVALFATSKTILSNLLGASRLLFDVGRDTGWGWLRRLTAVNPSTSTPIAAIALVTVAAAAVGAIGDLGAVAAASNILIMLVFLAVNVALLRLRRTETAEPAFRIPWSVGGYPVTAFLAIIGICCFLALNVAALFGVGS